MLRIIACVSGLLLIAVSFGCSNSGSAEPKRPPYYEPDGADVRLALTPKPGHPWMMTLTITNTGDRDVHVFLREGQIHTTVVAWQGERVDPLHTATQWKWIVAGGFSVDERRTIPPQQTVEESFDLLEYLGPGRQDVRHLEGFDYTKPVNIQVVMANPDPAGGHRKSNSVAVSLMQ